MATYSPASISRSMRSSAVVCTVPATWILLTPTSLSMRLPFCESDVNLLGYLQLGGISIRGIAGDDDALARRQPGQHFDLRVAAPADAHRAPFGLAAVGGQPINKHAAAVVDVGAVRQQQRRRRPAQRQLHVQALAGSERWLLLRKMQLDGEAAVGDLRIDGADVDRIFAAILRDAAVAADRDAVQIKLVDAGGQFEAAGIVDAADVLAGGDGGADVQADLRQAAGRLADFRRAHGQRVDGGAEQFQAGAE